MRMTGYFAAMAAVALPALLWAAWTGLSGRLEQHLPVALFAAVAMVALHSLLILFMIITGRVLREAMRSRPLGPSFLGELNAFFARKSAYPGALLAVLALVCAAVLGYGSRGFGISPLWHMATAVLALVVNLWAVSAEARALAANQVLLDRAARELDRIDREQVHQPPRERESDEPGLAPRRLGLVLALSAWLPYLYWALVVWKGRFERVPVWPFALVSVAGCALWLLAPRSFPARDEGGGTRS